MDAPSPFEHARSRERDLNERQAEVMRLVADGLTNGQIAERLGMSLDGAKWNVSEILTNLGLGSREEVADYWRWRNRKSRRLVSVFAPVATLRWAPGLLTASIVAVLAAGLVVAAVVSRAGGASDPSAPVAPAGITATATPSAMIVAASGTPSVVPTSTSGLPRTYPGETATGISIVDAVIVATASRDWDGLAALVRFAGLPCEAPRAIQPQPLRCPDGMVPGDILRGFPVTDVEGGLWTDDRLALAAGFRNVLDRAGYALHAVYDARDIDTAGAFVPAADYLVVFTANHPQLGTVYATVRTAADAVVALHFGQPPIDDSAWNDPRDPRWILPRAP